MPLVTSLRAIPPALRPSSTFHEAFEVLVLVFTQSLDLRLVRVSNMDLAGYGRLAAVPDSYSFSLEQHYTMGYRNCSANVLIVWPGDSVSP